MVSTLFSIQMINSVLNSEVLNLTGRFSIFTAILYPKSAEYRLCFMELFTKYFNGIQNGFDNNSIYHCIIL